ncbi:hypothetical protein MTR_3g022000 [Medicago truncatula]|uniref:Transmembrane protein n=1 Tax=Medicago truncatula TaxID=3880 RepID=A0A072UVH5_MEDTR|nr:hypothetical protein MTR_3g022000 [Medicago truncatula]
MGPTFGQIFLVRKVRTYILNKALASIYFLNFIFLFSDFNLFFRLRRIPRLECCEGSWEMMILVILLNKLNWSVQVIQFQLNEGN